MQATFKHVFGTRDPHASMDKGCNGHFHGASYLLLVDYTSSFPVVRKLTSMMAQHITGQIKLVFSEYVWQETTISNNGPCYSVEAFHKLMKDYSINYITSSPHYPQSNGLVEKYVQIVKTYSIKHKKRKQTCTKAWWFTKIPQCQALYNHPCRFCNHELPGHNSLCQMWPENNLDWVQNNLEWKARINSYHHMTYT